MKNNMTGLSPEQKPFIELFKTLTHRHNSWQVWSDFIDIAACSIANVFDLRRKDDRETMYSNIIVKYTLSEQQIFPNLLGEIVKALEQNPEQDFLGDLFMRLDLSNHWRGQFFTPYHICQLMAQMQIGDLSQAIEEKEYVSVNDPACGAGATLIAYANEARSRGINYQQSILFTAQDIDRTAALMCYVQLSLLGCGGYVIIGDSLRSPLTQAALDGPDAWYTPLYFMNNWSSRLKLTNNKMYERILDQLHLT